MMLLVITIIVFVLSAAAIFGAYKFLGGSKSGSTKEKNENLLLSIEKANQEIELLLRSKDSFIGQSQFNFIQSQKDSLIAEVEKERQALKEIETKLDVAQKQVEKKELEQQEIKSAKEEDLARLQELLMNFEDYSKQSMNLEQKLALSLKTLDSILTDLELTETQRETFSNLQKIVEEAGERLRDLLTEYQTVYERLTMLRQQHSDLEEEYTRLVEQQLGE